MQRLLSLASVFLPLAGLSAVSSAREKEPSPAHADYVILYAKGLESSARAWAEYRSGSGYTPRLIPWADFAASANPVQAARTAVHQAYRAGGSEDLPSPVGWLLILGDAPDGGMELSAPPETFKFDPERIPLHVHASLKDASRTPKPAAGDFIWALPPEIGPDVTGLVKHGVAGLSGGLAKKSHPREVAVGRIPARNDRQAMTVLEKVRRYESSPSGEWRRRLNFMAGEGRFGSMVDNMLEDLFIQFGDTIVPPDYEIGMTYASSRSAWACHPEDLTEKMVEGIQEGSLLTAYVGHGHVTWLDTMRVRGAGGREKRFPIGDRESITGRLKESRANLPVMLIVACQTGCFDHPEGESLGEALLFAPGGPVAVLAGSRDTHPYASAFVQKEFISAMTGEPARAAELHPVQQPDDVGRAWLAAQRYLLDGGDDYYTKIEGMAGLLLPKTQRINIREAHLWLYNLLGDPATRVQRPPAWPDGSLKVKETVRPPGSSFEVELARSLFPHDEASAEAPARIEARLEVSPSVLLEDPQAVDWDRLFSGSQAERAAERRKLEANYAMANRKVVSGPVTGEGSLADKGGTPLNGVSVPIPADLAPGNYRLRVSLQLGSGSQAKYLTRCYRVEVKA